MKLYTIVQPIDDSNAYVAWYTDFDKFGVVKVNCNPVVDLKAQSELVAIKYLLFSKKISHRDYWGAKDLSLFVSSGAIKKLQNGKSDKKELYKYFGFISTNLFGLELEVLKKHPNKPIALNINNYADFAGDIDVIDSEMDIETNLVETKFGKVRFTKHAIEQYINRNIFGEAKNPFRSMANQLQHPEIIKFEASPSLSKKLKYPNENTEYWGHPTSTLKFVLLKDEPNDKETNSYTLVTIYLTQNLTPKN